MTTESQSAIGEIRRRGDPAGLSSAISRKKPPYAASTWTRTPWRRASGTISCDRVDRSQSGAAGGGDDGADPALAEQVVERVEIHRPVGDGRDGDRLDAEQVRHPGVGVVRVGAVGDRLARVGLPGDEQRLEVGDRAAAGEVPEVRRRTPNIAASWATTSFSIAAVAGPPSSAWLLGLTSIAVT